MKNAASSARSASKWMDPEWRRVRRHVRRWRGGKMKKRGNRKGLEPRFRLLKLPVGNRLGVAMATREGAVSRVCINESWLKVQRLQKKGKQASSAVCVFLFVSWSLFCIGVCGGVCVWGVCVCLRFHMSKKIQEVFDCIANQPITEEEAKSRRASLLRCQ